MDKNIVKICGGFAAAVLFVAGCSQGSDSSTASNTPPPATQNATTPPPVGAPTGAAGTWAGVNGVLTSNCAPCHSGAKPKAGLDVSSYDGLMKGTKEGPVVVSGKPDDSLLVKAITGAAGVKKMPPRGDLAPGDVDSIKAWITAGAKQS